MKEKREDTRRQSKGMKRKGLI